MAAGHSSRGTDTHSRLPKSTPPASRAAARPRGRTSRALSLYHLILPHSTDNLRSLAGTSTGLPVSLSPHFLVSAIGFALFSRPRRVAFRLEKSRNGTACEYTATV